MTRRETPWPAGTPCWVDISVPDIAAAQVFYGPVLGWDFTESSEEYGGYVLAEVDGASAAGLGPQMAPGPINWILYFASEDCAATAEAIAANGGTVVFGPMEVGPQGFMAVAMDPTGAVFGVWQAKEMIGSRWVNAPGGLVWEDLRSTDPAAAQAFYSTVFGLTTSAVEMAPSDYKTLDLDGRPVAGAGGFMGDGPRQSHWLVSFAVASVDVVVDAVAAGGGRLTIEPYETPYGRMAGFTDPFGAAFHVVEYAGEPA